MLIKITMRQHQVLVSMWNTELLHTTSGIVNFYNYFGKLAVIIKFNVCIPYDPTISLLAM